MKRIRNIDDLRQEQRFVEQRRLQLEKELRRDWIGIKEMIYDAGNAFLGDVKHRAAGQLLSRGLSFGAGLLARKFGGKIGGKIFSWLK